MIFSNRFWVGILASATAMVAGCGTSASGICADVCDCTGCSEKEQEECVDSVEDQQKAADDEGCSDQYDAALSCYGDQLECRDSEIDLDGCDSEEEELANCAGGAGLWGIGGGVCDRAARICAAASGSEGSNGHIDCSGPTECASRCIVDANSCEPTEELSNCFAGCS